jgi:hypothetical protein
LYWIELIGNLEVPDGVKKTLEMHAFSAKSVMLMLANIVEYAKGAHERNDRISTQAENQPKSADSIIDDFAVEAQGQNALNCCVHYLCLTG